jgi:hypothetical protein
MCSRISYWAIALPTEIDRIDLLSDESEQG